MDVSLKQFKSAVANAKRAITAEPMEAQFIQLQAAHSKLWVGGRSAAISYNRAVPYTGVPTFRTIYLPITAADILPKNTPDDVLTLAVRDTDLLFNSSKEQGLVKTVTGMSYAAPFNTVSTTTPAYVLRTGLWLSHAIKLAINVKKGGKAKAGPYAAGFIRLAAYEEEFFREEEDAPLPDVCRLLLDDVTYDQERASAYSSSLALSVFASDEQCYYQAFEPMVIRAEPHDFNQELVVTTLADPVWIGQAMHIELDDAQAFVKLLEDEEYRVGIIEADGPSALVFFNNDTVLWLRLSLSKYPDFDFNRQLSMFQGQEVARLTPTKSFIDSIKSMEKINSTRKHGLTVYVEAGKVGVSSPESAAAVRFDSLDADTLIEESVTVIVNGSGLLAAFDTEHEISLVLGEDFLAIYNPTERTRVVLKQFVR